MFSGCQNEGFVLYLYTHFNQFGIVVCVVAAYDILYNRLQLEPVQLKGSNGFTGFSTVIAY